MAQILSSSTQVLKGIGKIKAQQLKSLNIFTIADLLFHFPRKYLLIEPNQRFSKLKHGQEACIRGQIVKVRTKRIRTGLKLIEATITDNQHKVNAIWFNSYNLESKLKEEETICVFGKVEDGIGGSLTIKVSEIIPNSYNKPYLPVYPSTGSGRNHLSQSFWRNLINNAIELTIEEIEESLPLFLRADNNLIGLKEAIRQIHFPISGEELVSARRRMIFQEIYLFQQELIIKRQEVKAVDTKHLPDLGLSQQFIKSLPFSLTAGQLTAVEEILADMQSGQRMYRLVQGDVGCGKTIVAIIAMLACLGNGYNAVLMVPTEVLAQQHYSTITSLTSQLGVYAALITSRTAKSQHNSQLNMGSIGKIFIGTQALIQESVSYSQVGLVVIDEQHKFGIADREKLIAKCNNSHILLMSATPIPGTLSMSLYGDMDITTIYEQLPQRQQVKTYYVPAYKRADMLGFINEQLAKGSQGYWVCSAIDKDGSRNLKLNTVEQVAGELEHKLAPYKVAALHSRLGNEQKDKLLKDFNQGQIGVLIATTVIEVGVDNQNATFIIIDDCDRFGLAQLHQLRGRIGRGKMQSYCFLLGQLSGEVAKRRIEILLHNHDGFAIANEDLLLRGPGLVAESIQHGLPKFKIANLVRDRTIIENCRVSLKKAKSRL